MPNLTPNSDVPQAVSTGRKRLVWGIALFLVVAHAWDNITWTEHWPISRYQMYSRIPPMEQMAQLRLTGLAADSESGSQREIMLLAEEHLPPFTTARLNAALVHLGHYANDSNKMTAAMNNLAYLYEKARRRGDHHGPKLKALRVYQVKWDLKPWADNVDSPKSKSLLVEANIDA